MSLTTKAVFYHLISTTGVVLSVSKDLHAAQRKQRVMGCDSVWLVKIEYRVARGRLLYVNEHKQLVNTSLVEPADTTQARYWFASKEEFYKALAGQTALEGTCLDKAASRVMSRLVPFVTPNNV